MDREVWTFRYAFIVGLLPAAVEEAVRTELGAVVRNHGHLQVLTATTEGYRAYPSGLRLVATLVERGVHIERTQPDYVNRKMIAERAGSTRQAVSLWVKGQRHHTDPFPMPFSVVPGETWLWSDVNRWLAQHGLPHDAGGELPTIDDHMRVDAHIAHNRPQHRATATDARAALRAIGTPAVRRD